jgi:hypothetical protein
LRLGNRIRARLGARVTGTNARVGVWDRWRGSCAQTSGFRARLIARSVAPTGFFYIVDSHPFTHMLRDGLNVTSPYFRTGAEQFEPGGGDYAVPACVSASDQQHHSRHGRARRREVSTAGPLRLCLRTVKRPHSSAREHSRAMVDER